MSVKTEIDNGVCVISLNRPERHNALDDATAEAYEAAFADAVGNSDVAVIVLRGEGPSFCSGRDTAQLGRRVDGESDFAFVRRHQNSRLAQVDCPKPVIAALKGNVLGGGLEMALAADIRVASQDVRMAFPEIKYGLMTDTGGSAFATMLAGPSRAKLMLMTGRRIGADQALAWGLVDELVAPEDLDDTTLSLAREIAQHGPLALSSIKQVVDETWHAALHSGVRAELLAQVALFSSPEYLDIKKKRQELAR
ncbi:enoyl-CoA hydratase/carnithine racemase [Nocardia kruczakiae]|uniref:Enoyl-CoA hydratase/carnithine racemase n=1 Tax=Nocardia kruczakiae TaxID=261477 RepID=A0ABU1XBB4_9NOCA|nr:enoyl-CoA hydratase/isomerase family protein [Nocardia kruczakiae]MDR7167322.1 enoyl-CoA hydratase/carnithine racemase [Nocardia kruczakiae]